MTNSCMAIAAVAAALTIQGCAGGAANRAATEPPGAPAALPEIAGNAPKGYLAPSMLPDSLALLPPPPGAASIYPDPAGFLYVTAEGVAKDFAQDLPSSQTRVMAVTQGPIYAKAFDEKVSKAAWKTKPSWYIVAANDREIQPDLERAMAKKINATTTVLSTCHVAMLSRPTDVAAVILSAAKGK